MGRKMDDVEILERLQKVISRVLLTEGSINAEKKISLSADTDLFDNLGIDSLEIMDLIAAAEKEFGVAIDAQEASTKRTIGELSDHISKLIVG